MMHSEVEQFWAWKSGLWAPDWRSLPRADADLLRRMNEEFNSAVAERPNA